MLAARSSPQVRTAWTISGVLARIVCVGRTDFGGRYRFRIGHQRYAEQFVFFHCQIHVVSTGAMSLSGMSCRLQQGLVQKGRRGVSLHERWWIDAGCQRAARVVLGSKDGEANGDYPSSEYEHARAIGGVGTLDNVQPV